VGGVVELPPPPPQPVTTTINRMSNVKSPIRPKVCPRFLRRDIPNPRKAKPGIIVRLALSRAIPLPAVCLTAEAVEGPFVVSVTCAVPLPFASSVKDEEENVHPTSAGKGGWQVKAKVTFASEAPPAKLSEYTADCPSVTLILVCPGVIVGPDGLMVTARDAGVTVPARPVVVSVTVPLRLLVPEAV
jgi:hypothetical protein